METKLTRTTSPFQSLKLGLRNVPKQFMTSAASSSSGASEAPNIRSKIASQSTWASRATLPISEDCKIERAMCSVSYPITDDADVADSDIKDSPHHQFEALESPG